MFCFDLYVVVGINGSVVALAMEEGRKEGRKERVGNGIFDNMVWCGVVWCGGDWMRLFLPQTKILTFLFSLSRTVFLILPFYPYPHVELDPTSCPHLTIPFSLFPSL